MFATILEVLALWFALSVITALAVGRFIYHAADDFREVCLADSRTIRPAA